MSAIKRRINYTGRKRITRDRIDVRIISSRSDEPLQAQAKLKLDGLGFPPTAGVVIDAYHRSTGMRFECGTVGNLKIPAPLTLQEIDQSGAVLFRVKIYDKDTVPGKLLGSAERISPREADDLDGKRSIFPIIQRDLVHEVWKIEFPDDTGPKLILNSRIPGITHRIVENPLAQGLLLPEALRIVLSRLTEDPAEEEAEEPSWQDEWIQFTQTRLGLGDDLTALAQMSVDEREGWVDQAVRIFCEQHGFVKTIKAMADGEAKHV